MSRGDADIIAEARGFLDELLNDGVPIKDLLSNGVLPEGWVSRYLSFVERVRATYGKSSPIPREVLAVIYCASVFCTKRLYDWQRRTGEENEITEDLVRQVRWAGDSFVMGQVWRAGKSNTPI